MPSSLKLLQGQPIRFNHVSDTDCANNDNRAYCNLVQDGDTIHWQDERITGTDVGCDFLDTDPTELFTNATFTGSAASWTLVGGFAYSANAVSVTADTGSVVQNLVLVDTAMYKITVTTTATTTGGDITILLSSTNIGVIPEDSPAGAYEFQGVADTASGTVCGIQAAAPITTTVTSIEMNRAAPCFLVDVIDGTATYDSNIGLTINGTVNITFTPTFAVSTTYSPKTTVNIVNYLTGTISFSFDGTASPALEGGNGETSWTLNGSNPADVSVTFTEFTGIVTEVSIEQLSGDYAFELYDLDGNSVQSLDAFIVYEREWVHLEFSPEDEGIAYGCYMIGLTDPYDTEIFSNCFNYKEEWECSKMIYAIPGENLGFNSDFGFAIAQRFKILRITPSYKVTGSDFIGSDGTRTLISGTGQKLYTLLFDYMDDAAHDVVMSILLCKEIYIATDYTNITNEGIRYFAIPQDYTPEWDKDQKLNLAMGRILILEYDQVKFTTNCGN